MGLPIVYPMKLELRNNNAETLHIHQYIKDSVFINIICTNNSVKLPIDSSTMSVRLKWLKPDNKPVFDDCTINTDGTVTILCTEQMCIASGEVKAELCITNTVDNSIFNSPQFKVIVDESVFSNDTITSSHEFDALNTALTNLEGIVTVINGHISNINNPHQVKKSQVGLGNVEDLSPANMPLSNAAKNATVSVYSASSTYAIGSYCLYNDVLYRCTTAITTAEAWNSTHWTATNIMTEVSLTTNNKQTSSTSLTIIDAISSTMYLTSWTKNLLTTMTLANLVSINTWGTWNAVSSTVSTFLHNGVTFTVNHISGVVQSIIANGTATANAYIRLPNMSLDANTTYTLGGAPSGSSLTTCYQYVYNNTASTVTHRDFGTGVTFTGLSSIYVSCIVISGQTVSSKTFTPQLETGIVKHNFVPPSWYTVTACKKNLLSTTGTTETLNGITATKNTDGSYTFSGTTTASYTKYLWSGAWYITQNMYVSAMSLTGASVIVQIVRGGTTIYSQPTSGLQLLSGDTVVGIYVQQNTTGTAVSGTIYPQIETGTAATTYEVYSGNSVSVTNDMPAPVPMTSYSGVTNVFNLYGGTMTVTYAVNEAGASILNHMATYATSSIYGHVKLSDSSAVTDSTGLALPATEKNASISGTLAYQIAQKATIANMFYPNSVYGGILSSDFNSITQSGFYTAYGTATGVPSSSYSWFVYHHNSNAGTASAYQRAIAFSTTLIVYERVKQGSTWGSWVNTSGNIVNAVSSTISSSLTGGYTLYGNMVFVDITITLATAITANSTSFITGLPTPSTSYVALSGLDVTASATAFIPYCTAGNIRSNVALTATHQINITGVYRKA